MMAYAYNSATQEEEIGMITVPGQPRQKVSENLHHLNQLN
jgi:hypothetical protein